MMQIEHPDGTQVLITRRFAASRERLFAAFTDAELMAAWIWGDDPAGIEVTSDARVGGTWSAFIDAPPGDGRRPGDRYGMRGVYAVVDAPARLVYTLHWDAPVGYNEGVGAGEVADEAVIVHFTTEPGGTTVVFHHVGIPDDGRSAAEHGRGVAATLATLARVVG